MNDDTGTHPETGARREIAALRERLDALTAATLRVSASLDLDTVLRASVDGACALTGARVGVIATDADAVGPGEFIVWGFTPEEQLELAAWPDRDHLFCHLRELRETVRVPDLADYARTLGLAPTPTFSRTFQGTPMHYRGVNIGSFFLLDKTGAAAFSDEDETVLQLFAAQAAAAIANARAYRSERRARADLEALIETSPVGVVVFDAPGGRPLSMNRAARRLIDRLRADDGPSDALPEAAVCRFTDGREIALDALGDALLSASAVRAEEVEVSVPDGRSVAALVNTTPIRAEDGAVVSVVITLQDLAPIRELERLRADFLGMVSHELRAPLAAILGSSATLLEDAAMDPAESREFVRLIRENAGQMRGLIGDLLDAGRIEAGTLSVAPEPSEVAALVERARNTFLSGGGRHPVLIDLPPALPPVMADRRRVVQVLNNLLANAARHSPESAPIRIAAERDGVHVAVSVADEGEGVPPKQLPHLFRKYDGPSQLSGSGLGLLICKGLVEAHGGRIRAESDGTGQGARFTFTLLAAGDAPRAAAPVSSEARPAPRGQARVLVVDDDPQTLRLARDALSAAGYAAVLTGDHTELSSTIRTEKPDLVLLDLVLPGADGIELMGIVPELADLPVVFISGYGRDETIAEALRAGAADYIVKPFSPTELAARVAAALRRAHRPEPFTLGDLEIHYEEHRVTVAGREVELTTTEYALLRILSLNAGRVVTFEALVRQIWPDRTKGTFDLVRNFVKKIRAKLGEDAAHPTWIYSVRGVGYRMPNPRGP